MQSGLFKSAIVLFAFILGAPLGASAQHVQSDFDNDGLSELVVVNEIESGLDWDGYNTVAQSLSSLGVLGSLGDHLLLGDFLGSGDPQIGVVSGSFETGAIVWRVLAADQSVKTANHGELRDFVMAGADFNGDGTLDGVAFEKSGKRWKWKVNQALFADGGGTATETLWGGVREQPFFFNPEGDADRMATIRRTGIRAFAVRYRNVATGQMKRFRGTGSFGSVRPVARPVPVAQADGTDLLMVSKAGADSTVLTFLNVTTGVMSSATVSGTGTVVTGNFTADPGEEVLVKGDSGFTSYNPATQQTALITAVDGIPVDEININQITDGNYSGPIGDTPDDNLPASLDNVCASRSPISIGQLLIKSEISDHINLGDPRATGYTLVCASQCPANQGKADFFYSDGSYAGSVAKYGLFSGNGKPRLYGAVGAAPQHFVSQIAPKARSIGNGKLYMQMSKARTGASTSCKEFNPTGRNGGL